MTVARIAGISHQHLAARRQQRTHGEKQRAGGPRRDGDARAWHVHAVTHAVKAGDCIAQFGDAERWCVADAPALDGADAGFRDQRRHGSVGFAHHHVGNRASGRFQFLGAVDQYHYVERFDFPHA